MKIGISTCYYDDKPLEDVLKYVSGLGYEMVELTSQEPSNHLNLDKVLKGGATAYKKIVSKYGLAISSINSDHVGALVLGPHDMTTDDIHKGTPAEKVRYGMETMKKTAEAAAALDVPVVVGLIGAPNWAAWYICPPKYEQIYEEGFKVFAERWNEILDHFGAQGIKFALEVHPHQQAYNIETAEQALKAIKYRKEFGFNFDPSHLLWQGIDPVIFIKKFGDQIYHAHAKDAELVKENIATSGCMSTGDWRRPTRGFRFRVPGWGQVPWKRVMTALMEVGYNYVISYEHEDPVMSREDGCEKTIAFLKPLIIKKPLEKLNW